MEEDKLDEMVKNIEHELYVLFNRDTGAKYKAKYRSLVSNIRDEKNDEFFKNIINGTIKPKALVSMSAEDMANKELKEWRNSTNKHDIEKIKSHELDLLKMGSKLVIKTHKGDEVRETGNEIKNTESVLPDDVEHKSESRKSSSKDRIKIHGAKTWDHGKYETCKVLKTKDCDVCDGKITEDAFLEAKFEREKRHKDRHRSSSSRDKDRKRSHKSSSSRKDKDRDRDRDKDRDKNRDRDKHRDKDRHRHSSKDKDKKKSSSKHEASDESNKKEEEAKVAPEVVEKKIAEILASSGALDVAKSSQEMYNIDEGTSKEPKIDDSLEVVQDDFNEPTVDIDIPALSQPDENDDIMKEAEVTSTVSIETPEESIAGSSNPSVWNGQIGTF